MKPVKERIDMRVLSVCLLLAAVPIIKGIVNIAKILHLKIVCEGVETYGQKELLKSIGCDLAQGYYYAKPMERKKLEELLIYGKKVV